MTTLTNTEVIVVRTERGLTIAGTRITLYNIMDYVTAGYPAEHIQHLYSLTDAQIAGALAYIADHRAEVEAEYQQVLHDAEETRRYWEVRNHDSRAAIAARPPRPEIAAMRAKLEARRVRRQRS